MAGTQAAAPETARQAPIDPSTGLSLHPTAGSAAASPVGQALQLARANTRTHRNHGVFLLGRELASVYSSRRDGDALGVTMTVGNGTLQLSGSMTPAQARSMARALVSAAAALERQPAGGAR